MLVDRHVEETRFSFSPQVPAPPERRQTARHLTILRVGALILEGRRELCLIRNISAGGLMAHVYSPLAEDTAVTVELKTNQSVRGRVVWIEDNNVGIEFDEPIDVAELLSNPPALANGWRPRMPRVEIDRMATLRIGARTLWARACDISQGGVKIELEEGLEPDTAVVLTLEGFRPVQAIVRWHSEGYCGIAFNQPLPFGELMTWLRPERRG